MLIAHLQDRLQIAFEWGGEHLHDSRTHGKNYGSDGAATRDMQLRDVRLRCGERFQYAYNDFADRVACPRIISTDVTKGDDDPEKYDEDWTGPALGPYAALVRPVISRQVPKRCSSS
jgi:hypothetical protein